ncbi:MAG: protein kinase, partial [Candidatus Sericytochromatia bacterium]|nr:protein kinase [Candidatus Sericytochromatia bacterium]
EAINITIQVLKILEYLHNFLPQIIHRDIKPSNILVDQDNIVYLIDFGSVKEKLTYGNISQSGISTIIGTQGYMSIDQFEGKAIPSSDIYSLGLTLLYILSHKEPLQLKKNGLNFLFRDVVNISDKFELIISKMIDPDYTKRYMNIPNLKRDLNALDNQKIKINIKDNKSMNSSVQGHLSEDEKIIWLERPILKKAIFKPYLMLNVIFGSLLSFFSFTFVLILILITITTHFISLPITAILGFIALQIMLVGIGLITRPYYAIKKSLNTVYAVTNKRVLLIPPIDNNQKINIFLKIPLGIIRAIGKGYPIPNNFKSLPMFAIRFMENNFNSTELTEILEYLNHVVEIDKNDLKKIVIERNEYKDGSGDLIFYRGEDEKKNPVLKIIAVNNPKKLEQIIISTLKKE